MAGFTQDDLKNLLVMVGEANRSPRYKYGIIYQEFQTEFNFMDGTPGYGSPYAPNDESVYLVRDSEPQWL